MTDSPFDLNHQAAYRHWRDAKRKNQPRQASDLVVPVADPRALSQPEQHALLQRCAVSNMAIYRSPLQMEDKAIPRQLAQQLGMQRLDGNWLADEDGVSQITVSNRAGERAGFIPYTNRPIKWHTDGYYLPQSRHIRAMILHCVRAAGAGGEGALMDHEMAYIALREANPDWVRALMAPDAMTIPERLDQDGVARAEQSGPVFSVDPSAIALHMRYTARTHSVIWKNDPATRAAVAFLEQFLANDESPVFRLTLHPGMGVICNNVLHDRTGFVDDPQHPRLLYRARYLDRLPLSGPASERMKVAELLNK